MNKLRKRTHYLQITSVSAMFLLAAGSLLCKPTLFSFISPCSAIPRVNSPVPAVTAETDDECVVGSGEFGILGGPASDVVSKHGNSSHFVVTAVVPLVVDQPYGWRIHVTPSNAKVHWKEEFSLPAVPKVWGGVNPDDTAPPLGKQQTLEKGGQVCISEKDVFAVNGAVSNFWAVAKGDPPGKYKMRVWINGTLAKTFEFQVKPVPMKGNVSGVRKQKEPPSKAKE